MKMLRIVSVTGLAFFLTMCGTVKEQRNEVSKLDLRARELKIYANKNGFSTRYCFLIDMGMQSGLKRFFVYDLKLDKVAFSGLVAHGSCEQDFLKEARFSNTSGCGCTSSGIYKVGYAYYGQYGKSYKLHGLQSSNSNAFSRAVVLHGFSCVPDQETYPKPICNSLGCPMVSPVFLDKLSSVIDGSGKPVLLWIYETPAPRLAGILRPH